MLAQAKYWAWTGVPFVYLWNPDRAGGWPVCHDCRVWRDAVGCAQLDGLARAVVRAGVRGRAVPLCQIRSRPARGSRLRTALRFRAFSRRGRVERMRPGRVCFPTVSRLRPQLRNDPAINPGTLLTEALRYYDRPALYDFRAFRSAGVFVHAPGEIDNARENGQAVKDAPDPNSLKTATLRAAGLQGNATGHKISFVAHGWTSRTLLYAGQRPENNAVCARQPAGGFPFRAQSVFP